MNSLNNPPDSIAGMVRWAITRNSFYARNKAEYDAEFEFVINVPSSLFNASTDVNKVIEMKAWVDVYRVAGSRYQIVNY